MTLTVLPLSGIIDAKASFVDTGIPNSEVVSGGETEAEDSNFSTSATTMITMHTLPDGQLSWMDLGRARIKSELRKDNHEGGI